LQNGAEQRLDGGEFFLARQSFREVEGTGEIRGCPREDVGRNRRAAG
jgi:ribosomal protein S14